MKKREDMKKLVSMIVVAGLVGFSGLGFAGEHPEHPTQKVKKEHPTQTKKEHPEHQTKKIEMLTHKQMVKSYVKEIEHLVKNYNLPVMTVEGKGVLVPKDTRLVKIHTKKIIRYNGDTYFACADFSSRKTGAKYDFDFFMTKNGKGWKMEKVLYHKLDGKLQLTYNDQCEAIPVE